MVQIISTEKWNLPFCMEFRIFSVVQMSKVSMHIKMLTRPCTCYLLIWVEIVLQLRYGSIMFLEILFGTPIYYLWSVMFVSIKRLATPLNYFNFNRFSDSVKLLSRCILNATFYVCMQKRILILLNYFLMIAYRKNIQVDLFIFFGKDYESNFKGKDLEKFYFLSAFL